ncbi:MAG TPA: D-arabinono-1,4-lactone oxidase [Acidimicrobiales bacterium]|nr:D-arabinono-1,4-lactone oxidase [Acidimicrobiales bacterium]
MAWKNWAGNQTCNPDEVAHPSTDAELAAVVKGAAARGRRVKVVGSGHSFTACALTDGVQIVLDRYDKVIAIDRRANTVTVQAGCTIADLNKTLYQYGMAMPNLGDIAYQTISGAISTATHGTGVKLTGIAGQVIGLDIVAGDGSIVSCSRDEEPDVFESARVGVGALGALSTVTLQCVPTFNLHAVEEPIRVDTVLEEIDARVDDNEHFEFFWVPHTGWALTKTNNRTTQSAGGQSRAKFFKDKILMENIAFGAVTKLGRLRPSAIPRLSKLIPSSGRVEYVKPSYQVFASPRWVKFYEMEYSVPRQHVGTALNGIRKLIDDEKLFIGFPVEVRFTAGDDIPLSTASGRESAYLAVHVAKGMDYETYFRGVEDIMNGLEGRPHWGKLHFQTADVLATRYPKWDAFQKVRAKLDPNGVFANAYTDRVLGVIG